MEFKDFPMFLGKSGKYEIHPPKLCASLGGTIRYVGPMVEEAADDSTKVSPIRRRPGPAEERHMALCTRTTF